jgi:DNA-binding LytR/AlgR family response regulator
MEELNKIISYISEDFNKLDLPHKISSFSEGHDLLDNMASSEHLYEIIFLDVFMSASNGIDIAKQIRKFDKDCKIIFITSSKDYAIDSYEVGAMNYILKPINKEKLNAIIKVAVEGLNNDNKQLIIRNKKGNYRIIYKDILYIESSARILNINLKSGEEVKFYSKLDDFIERVQDKRFYRCHKSFAVNMDYILKIENGCVFMKNDIKIPISSHNLSQIKEKYFNYILNMDMQVNNNKISKLF